MEHVNPGLVMFLSGLVSQLPQLVVSLVALFLVQEKLKHAPAAAKWALAGFGLALGLCLLIPAVTAVVQPSVIQSGLPASRIALVFAGMGMFWSLLHAAVLGLLLAAVLAAPAAPQTEAATAKR